MTAAARRQTRHGLVSWGEFLIYHVGRPEQLRADHVAAILELPQVRLPAL